MKTAEVMTIEVNERIMSLGVSVTEIVEADKADQTNKLNDEQLKDIIDKLDFQITALKSIKFNRDKVKAKEKINEGTLVFMNKSEQVAKQGIKSAKSGLKNLMTKINNSLEEKEETPEKTETPEK